MPPGTVTELRILHTRCGTVSGYFDDPAKLARAAAAWDGRASGLYFTLNPVRPELLARSANRLTERARQTTGDKDILRRRWLPIDFDPVRPSGISSTKAEHQAALDRAREARDWLREVGWPAPVLASSGNGAHLLYPLDLPPVEDVGPYWGAALHCVLQALNLRFGDDRVVVDTTTANASRIWKLYGTRACKGDDTPDRPHRIARMLDLPWVEFQPRFSEIGGAQ
jgi:hypothetical protein